MAATLNEFFFHVPELPGPLSKLLWRAEFSDRGLRGLTFNSSRAPQYARGQREDARLTRLLAALSSRLNGGKDDLAWDDFDLRGAPPFHLKAWRAMRRIPFGEVASYAQLAATVGSPRAFRACGQACAANPIVIFIPCHRVVGANGLGGFSGGLENKALLLAHERELRAATCPK